MTSERWQLIDSIFQTALELDSSERTAFLEESCSGDPELRKEVESLISFSERQSGFMDSIALSEGMRAIARSESAELAAGQRLGSYEIVSRLGEGGTAEVYLARDLRLGRNVALKTLQSDLASDESGLRRFRQEARAVSALNHPNIVTIHEIVQVEQLLFIATEFIDGETLRSRLSRSRLSLWDAVEVATQVASALSAAHHAGIVHRDIKPENLMIRHDGYVKVLDFGLAKLTRSHLPSGDLANSTAHNTQPGIILGTIRYMSPEQARGLDVDNRTDIWSLGVVLYEMVSGRAPFEGETATDVIVSILEREPALSSPSGNEIPGELTSVIAKCLAKERSGRYQTIDEVLTDIRRLKQRIEIDAHLAERGLSGHLSGSDAIERNHPVIRAGSPIARGPLALVKHHRYLSTALLALILLAIGGGLFGIFRPMGNRLSSTESAAHFAGEPVSRLTADGRARLAALSPDGKYLACVVADANREGLVVKQVFDTASHEIIPPSGLKFRGVTFSPDSNDVYYVAAEDNKDLRKLYKVSILGGSPRKILERVDSPITFSLDGKRFAFIRDYPAQKESSLIIAPTEGGEERVLATQKEPNHFWLYGPSWSPDGSVIATSADNKDDQGTYMSIIGISESDGSQRTITRVRWSWIEQVAWLRDGHGLIVVGKENSTTAYQLYEIEYPGGETVAVTNDLVDYHGVSLSSDATYLASMQREEFSSIWVASAKEFKRAAQVARARGRAYAGISWTREGEIIYASTESGNFDIWLMDPDGKNQRQLTVDSHTDYSPVLSNDGKYIVFVSDRAGSRNLWRMDLDGSHVTRLTYGAGELAPHCAPDGWIVYTSFEGDRGLWRVPLEGGDPVRLNFGNSIDGAVSPDGRSVVCQNTPEGDNSEARVAVFRLADSNPKPMFVDIPIIKRMVVKWSPDGRALTYVASDGGLKNIWNRPLNGGRPARLTDISSDEIFDLAWSPDGKRLAYVLGTPMQNVVLIRRSGAKTTPLAHIRP